MFGGCQEHRKEYLLNLEKHSLLDLSEIQVQELRALGLFKYFNLSETFDNHHSGNFGSLIVFSFIHDNLDDVKSVFLGLHYG